MVMIATQLDAWEINTHRAIDQVAIGKSTNLKNFINSSKIKEPFYEDAIQYDGYGMTYIQYIDNGETNGISQWRQKFDFKPEKKKASIRDLLEAGTILEDAQWPHGWEVGGGVSGEWWEPGTWVDAADRAHGRFLNHFYNVQGICKSLKCATTDAITWAYDSQKNAYDYQSAMDYFSRGFSETKPRIRRKYQAKMLVAVGHMMHMINDMNVPAHTRDDGHNPDPLEWWMRRDIVLA